MRQAPLGLHLAPVNVDGVADGLERVERDPERDEDGQRVERTGHPGAIEESVERAEEEILVLEVGEDAEVHADAGEEQRAATSRVPGAIHQPGESVIGERRRADEEGEFGAPRGVEVETRDDQPPDAHAVPTPRGQPVHTGDDREENQERLRLEERFGQQLVELAEVRELRFARCEHHESASVLRGVRWSITAERGWYCAAEIGVKPKRGRGCASRFWYSDSLLPALRERGWG